jgi:hypothetical protein
VVVESDELANGAASLLRGSATQPTIAGGMEGLAVELAAQIHHRASLLALWRAVA